MSIVQQKHPKAYKETGKYVPFKRLKKSKTISEKDLIADLLNKVFNHLKDTQPKENVEKVKTTSQQNRNTITDRKPKKEPKKFWR